MFDSKKNVFALILITSFVLFLASSPLVRAQVDRELEMEYPEIGGWRPETVEQAVLPEYIKYIFTFSVAIAGLVAFGALIYGGFRYITSAGAPTAQTEARDQIFAGVIGLVILLSSYLILTTINPQLTLLKSPKLLTVKATEIPGVYLSTKMPFPSDKEIEDGAKVYLLTSTIDDLSTMVDGEIKSLRIVNQSIIKKEEEELKETPAFYYGVISHAKKNREGDCEIHRSFGHNEPTETTSELIFPPTSITVFREVEKAKGGEVILYSGEDRGGNPLPISPTTEEKSLEGFEVWSIEISGDYLLFLRG
ncbi:MAG: pilin, partial [bacterium]|nr:pilin [bacterium]